MGERGGVIRTMQRAMNGKQRELAVFQLGEDDRAIVGRVVGKGLADELYDKDYLIVDGTDGKAHYVALPPRAELEQYPAGSIVEVKGAAGVRAASKPCVEPASWSAKPKVSGAFPATWPSGAVNTTRSGSAAAWWWT